MTIFLAVALFFIALLNLIFLGRQVEEHGAVAGITGAVLISIYILSGLALLGTF